MKIKVSKEVQMANKIQIVQDNSWRMNGVVTPKFFLKVDAIGWSTRCYDTKAEAEEQVTKNQAKVEILMKLYAKGVRFHLGQPNVNDMIKLNLINV